MKTINAGTYIVYIGNDASQELDKYLSNYSNIYILVDENSKRYCLQALRKAIIAPSIFSIIQVKSGEKNKTLSTCEKIWKTLSKDNADRNTLIINLGGGVITDLGAFAAATYKRGVDFINIPTTLLSQVDASVGGKTGIDFLNFKNQIGTFTFPKAVFVMPNFLKTLPQRELLSGFSEIIKHGLISDKKYWELILSNKASDLFSKKNVQAALLEDIITKSISIKNKIVLEDPREKNIRKALNFGHTIGHAVESTSLKTKKKLLHGEAIAIGMICESYLSRKCCGLSTEELESISAYIKTTFKPNPITTNLKSLLNFMKQDKKNINAEINFTLISKIGKANINNTCSADLIEESINYYNEICN